MLDEVYDYGSSSRAGCSRPASPAATVASRRRKLRAPGDGVCSQCHAADNMPPSRTTAATADPALACASCHMPVRTYMVVASATITASAFASGSVREARHAQRLQ